MKTLQRRDFLIRAGQAAAAILGGAALSPALAFGRNEPDKRPNIIFVLTDDQRYDAMSCAGHPFVKTPNIDRLAKEGVRFRNAFVTTALCSPSRSSFLTGCYINRTGVIVNGENDPTPDLPTFPEILQKNGYETAYIGKWHMAPTDAPRPGFDHWVSFKGQGHYTDYVLNVDGKREKPGTYITDELNKRAIEFIRRPGQKPFLLILSHKAVHGPFTPAERHAHLYENDKLPNYDDPRDKLEDKPGYIREGAMKRRGANPSASTPAFAMNYLRTLAAVDDGLGDIYSALKEKNVLDDTAIVFAGDNGHFMGEHGGQGDKRKAYEPSMRIPLLMRYPKAVKAGALCGAMTLNIDLAPTLLGLAGLSVPGTVQGESWMPLLEGRGKPRESFFYEYYDEALYKTGGRGMGGTPTTLAVRTPDWKYVTTPELKGEIDELYDLKNDPGELYNLSRKPEHADTLEMMKKEMARLKKSIDYKAPKRQRDEEVRPGAKPAAGADRKAPGGQPRPAGGQRTR